MVAKTKPDPRRVRLTIPAADESSQAWIDLQDDPSASMRMLIRESIQRDGYVDVVNRPVEQQPRRGRPPKSEEEDFAQPPQVAAADEIDGPEPAEAEPEEEPRHEVEGSEERSDRTPPTEEPQKVEQAVETISGEGSGGQVDMDAIFGHNS